MIKDATIKRFYDDSHDQLRIPRLIHSRLQLPAAYENTSSGLSICDIVLEM